jgi:hypothetical protein
MTAAYLPSTFRFSTANACRLWLACSLLPTAFAEEEKSKPKPIIKATVTVPSNSPMPDGESYLPIILNVENAGESVQVKVIAYLHGNRRTLKNLSLPAGAKKRVPLYVQSWGFHLRVEIRQENDLLWSDEKTLKQGLRTGPIVGELPARIVNEGQRYYLDRGESLELSHVAPDELPTFWRAYGPHLDTCGALFPRGNPAQT